MHLTCGPLDKQMASHGVMNGSLGSRSIVMLRGHAFQWGTLITCKDALSDGFQELLALQN